MGSLLPRKPSGRKPRSGSLLPAPEPAKPKSGSFFSHAVTSPHSGGGVGGWFGNVGKSLYGIGPGIYTAGRAVAHDVAHHPVATAVGLAELPAAPLELAGVGVKNPKALQKTQTYRKVVRPAAKSYAYKYGPVVKHPLSGKAWKKTAHRALVEDPVGTALDVGTVASAGVGAATKVGLLPEAARSVVLRSPGALEGTEGAKVIEKGIAGRSNLSRHLRITAHSALNRLPADFPVFGQTDRYAKALSRRQDRTMLAKQFKVTPYQKALSKLSPREEIAANLMHDYPSRRLLDMKRAELAANPKADAAGLAQISDPKVLKLFDHPTPKMQRYLDESRKLGELNTAAGGIAPATAETRRYQQALLLHGASIRVDAEALQAMLKSDKVPEFRKRQLRSFMDRPDEGAGIVPGQVVHAADRQNYGKIISVNGDHAEVHFVSPEGGEAKVALPLDQLTPVSREAAARQFKLPVKLQAPEGTTIPEMIAKEKATLAAEGRPEPLYRKHASVETPRGTSVGAGGGAPQPPRAPGARQSQATLATLGKVAYNIDTLTPAYLRNVKHSVYVDKHADFLASGKHVPKGYTLKPGEEFLKQTRTEKIGYAEKTAGDYERAVQEDLGHELLTRSEGDAFETPDGYRVVIPSRLRERVISEYTKNSKAVDWFFKKPTNVWRALVLNLRVGWLVNNLVGNSLLYAVSNAGPRGLRSYLGAVADIHGVRTALKLVDDSKITSRITPADMAELLPDQVAGTFFGTQLPKAGSFGRSKAGKTATAIPRVLRHVDVGYEQALRRAIANRVLRGSPEVKARYAAMPKEARNWRQAATKELASNPALADRVSREINNSLGDFRNLSDLEQRVIRQAAPFYAWYRAITLVMVKMPLDNPLRSNILWNLGQIGAANEYPLYGPGGVPIHGAVGVGSGLFKTAGMNPYSTLPSTLGEAKTLGEAAVGQIPGTHFGFRPDSQDVAYAAGLLNPIIGAPLTGGLLKTARNLPEGRLIAPPPSKTYSDAGFMAELLGYLGAPYRHPNKKKKH